MKNTKYLALPKDGVLVGPQTLVWINSNNFSTHDLPFFKNVSLCCLPWTRPSQKLSFASLSMLMPSTRLRSDNNFTFSTPRCPNRSCHSWILFDSLETIKPWIVSANFVSHYNQYRPFSFRPSPTTFFCLFMMTHFFFSKFKNITWWSFCYKEKSFLPI